MQLKDGVPALGIFSQLIGNFGQALVAAMSVRYFVKGQLQLDSFRAVTIFVLVRGYSRAFSGIRYCRVSLCAERLGAGILVRMARAGFIQRAVDPDDYSADIDGFWRWTRKNSNTRRGGVMWNLAC